MTPAGYELQSIQSPPLKGGPPLLSPKSNTIFVLVSYFSPFIVRRLITSLLLSGLTKFSITQGMPC